MIDYQYVIQGLAVDNDQTWKTSGTVKVEKPGEFMQAIGDAMKHSFNQLTNGKAIYGKPGVGCKGPYHIMRLEIKQGCDHDRQR